MGDQAIPGAPAAPLVLDLDALTSGDLEDMEAYAGVPILPVLRTITEALADEQGMFAALSSVPVKAVTALLGVARRMQDPSFGPERWREVRLADLLAPGQNGDGTGPGAPPPTTPAPVARSPRRSAAPRGSSSSSDARSTGSGGGR